MRFLVDTSSDARLARYLQRRGFDATRVGWDYPQDLTDEAILTIGLDEDRVILTDDRDFGELIFRLGPPHSGVIYFRIETVDVALRIARLEAVLAEHSGDLERFIVVTKHAIRVRDT